MSRRRGTDPWDSASTSESASPHGVTPDTIRRWADITNYIDDDEAASSLLPDPETSSGEIISLRMRNRELLAIREIAQRLIAPFHLGQFVCEIITTCCSIMKTEAGSVLLQEAGTGKLHFFRVRGQGADMVREFILEKGQGIAGWVAETGRSCLVNTPAKDPRFFGDVDRRTGFETRSILCSPIQGPHGVIGVVEVLNKKDRSPFSAEDQAFLEVLCAEIAVAIESFRAREEAQRKDRVALVGSMASSIIHDLKNPMTIIKGYTYLHAQEHPESRSFCSQIEGEIDRLTELAEEILGVAKGSSRVRKEEVQVAPFVQEFGEFIRARMGLGEIDFRIQNLYDGRASFDGRRLRRALFNLVTNALDAVPRGGRIEIRSERSGDDLHLTVSDNGRGIPREIRARLFDPFHSSGTPGGTGLGLAIVQNIVQAHGGRLKVESEEGEGTKVHLFLPA